MDRLQLAQVWTGDLDGIAGDGEDDDVLPRVELVLVLDHLGPLPVVLDACPLEAELFDFDGDGAPSLRLDDSDVILRLFGEEMKGKYKFRVRTTRQERCTCKI